MFIFFTSKFSHSGILYILFAYVRHELNSINNRLYVVLSFVDSLLSWITGIGKKKDIINMFYISNTDYTCFMYMFLSLSLFYIYLSWSIFVGNLLCARLWNDHFTYLTCFTSQEVWFFTFIAHIYWMFLCHLGTSHSFSLVQVNSFQKNRA